MPTEVRTVRLVDLVLGSRAVVVGRVGRFLGQTTFEGREFARMFGRFEIVVEEVIVGDPPKRLELRVAADPAEERAWVINVQEGRRLLLFLTVDPMWPAGGVFVPVLAGGFPVVSGRVRGLPDRVRSDMATTADTISLSVLGRAIAAIVDLNERSRAQLARVIGEKTLDRPHPGVSEIAPGDLVSGTTGLALHSLPGELGSIVTLKAEAVGPRKRKRTARRRRN